MPCPNTRGNRFQASKALSTTTSRCRPVRVRVRVLEGSYTVQVQVREAAELARVQAQGPP